MNATAAQLAQPEQQSVSQERLLLNYVQRLERHRAGRRAVHIHLSRIRDTKRRGHHLKIAGNTFEGLVQQFEGQMFTLNNGDLMFVCKDASVEEMDEAVQRLLYLFSDDPLAMTDIADDFSTWYNLEAQFEEFQAIANQLFEQEQARQERLRARAVQWGQDKSGAALNPGITPEQLGKLSEYLQSADLSSFVRRQQVCAIANETKPKRIFKELYISIDELAGTVLPGVNLSSDRWLFQYLTRTLDDRVLKLLLRADDSDLHTSFSVNMNVTTLLSPDFLKFDSQLRMGGRGTIVIELQMIDIFADVSEYMFARDFLREKGYRICLDGISAESLAMIDRDGLGADLVKLTWNDSLAEPDPESPKAQAIKAAIDRCGKARIIISRCDSPEAIRFGQRMGITMFQGRLLDSVLHEEARFGNSSTKL